MLNTITSILFEIVTIICGFVTPKLILNNFGSEVNGLVSSISQFLGFVTLADCGVGSVVQAAFYKPLAEKDDAQISCIFVSSERFFRKISLLVAIYTVALMLFYPFFRPTTFEYTYTFTLIFAISVALYAQYFLGITSRMLLTADQYGFIGVSIQTVSLLINTFGCYVLINMGASIQKVKIMTSLVLLVRPIVLSLIVRRMYKINRKIKFTQEPIKQKWNGLAQHIASVVLNNTDVMVLTMFSTLENVSIYSVYFMVVNGIKVLLISSTNGTQSLMGNMLAKKEYEKLEKFFSSFEWFVHTGVTLFFCVTGLLVVPFVQVYTRGITDVNYIVSDFAVVIVIAQACYCLRLPYSTIVLSAGHFKQTQGSAVLEAVLNVVVSVLTVIKWGLVGVAVGTLTAMLYRTLYFIWYLTRNIMFRSVRHFAKHLLVDIIVVVATVGITGLFPGVFAMKQVSYGAWILLALKTGLMTVAVSLLVNFLTYREYLKLDTILRRV